VVDRYDAVLSPDGTLTETYIYHVKADQVYRMLYRSWEVPLSFGSWMSPRLNSWGWSSLRDIGM